MNTKITNKISITVLVFLALILFGVTIGTAAPGDLDATFGSGGVVVTPFSSPVFYVVNSSMLVQPDGKIVVCGGMANDEDQYLGFFLARYHPTGALDASFGTNGINIDFSGPHTGSDIALQPDGKIVAVGFDSGFAVRRYNANGTLDASFGAGGFVVTPFGNGVASAESVAIRADGKIVVVGFRVLSAAHSDFAVVRYNPNGSLDTSFNGTGKVITSLGNRSVAYAAVLQPDGKIVAAGYAGNLSAAVNFALARYNTDGSLDSGFGAGGKVIHAVSTNDNFINDVALQPDGKIVVTGWFDVTNGGTTRSAIVRYNTNGSIDTSFSQNGIFTTEAGFVVGNSIALQPDGKLVAFGDSSNGWSAVARLNPNGTPDTGFGTNGRVITPNLKAVVDGAVQSDGKILAVGVASARIEIARYLGDSAAPRPAQFDFDGDGRSDISVFRPTDRVWYLNQSTNGFYATQFGLSTDKITPADYDGDGKTDIAVYRASEGIWYLLQSSSGFKAVRFGNSTDIPTAGDFDGDGSSDIAVFRPETGVWYFLYSSNNSTAAFQFGLNNDLPVVGDYDGDAKSDVAVFRPENGFWYLQRSSAGFTALQFGLNTDKLVTGDYDGDGRTDVAVYRPSEGNWYLQRSTAGFGVVNFGISTDIPVSGDYDGDGKTDIAVFRPSTGVWHLQQSSSGLTATQFGLTNDLPIPSAFVP